MKNESKNLYTARREDGTYGLYTRIGFYANSPIIDINSGDQQDESDWRTIETNAGYFIHPEGMFTNHSCDPSCFVLKSVGLLLTLRELKPDEEITFDYLASEKNLKANFTCHCGSYNCYGKIGIDK